MDDPHLAFVVGQETAKEHARWLGPDTEARWDVNHASPVDGVDAAISGWAATGGEKASGQELWAEKEKLHGNLVRAARER